MKMADMDEREYNRFQNLEAQAEKAYKDKQKSYRTEKIYKDGVGEFCKYLAVETKINKIENFKAKHVIVFVQQMQERGISPATQKNIWRNNSRFRREGRCDQRTIPTNKRLK
ncbi:MAG: phage integrase N-terminal SAM-like domain-containing protein [Clostridium paraputrificum]